MLHESFLITCWLCSTSFKTHKGRKYIQNEIAGAVHVFHCLSSTHCLNTSLNNCPKTAHLFCSVTPVRNYSQHGLHALDIRTFTLYLSIKRVNDSHFCDVLGDWKGKEVLYSGSYWGKWPSISINCYQCCNIQFRYNIGFNMICDIISLLTTIFCDFDSDYSTYIYSGRSSHSLVLSFFFIFGIDYINGEHIIHLP